MAFTDGDRQFKVADIGRLTARLAAADAPDVVVGFRIKRADPLVRTLYARAYRLANRIFFGLKVTDVDCACKLFRREALEGLRVESGGAFFSAEMIIKLRAAGRTVVEVGVPHYPRTAGSATGAKPQVVLRAVRDFWLLTTADVGEPIARAAPRRADGAAPEIARARSGGAGLDCRSRDGHACPTVAMTLVLRAQYVQNRSVPGSTVLRCTVIDRLDSEGAHRCGPSAKKGAKSTRRVL